MSEEAKAMQEVAKTTGKCIDAASGFGSFLQMVFGDLLVDAVGIIADKVKYFRLERAIRLGEKTKKRLEKKGIRNTQHVLPKIGIPLIEQATLEEDDELHTRWANMLSNAMDPHFQGNVKRNFITILSDMQPIDVLILESIMNEYLKLDNSKKNGVLFDRYKIQAAFRLNPDACEISLRNLIRLGCLKPGVIITDGFSFGNEHVSHNLTVYKDIELVGVTAFGEEFYKAVS